jgi:hypothetical protein
MCDGPRVTMAGQGHDFGRFCGLRSATPNHNCVTSPIFTDFDLPRELPDSSCRVNAKSAIMVAELRSCSQS